MPRFEIIKSTMSGQYFFHLTASNGEKILASEGYTSKQNCMNGITTVKENATNDSRYRRNNGQDNFTFNLLAANGEIIGRSENYVTEAGRDNGIEAVKRDAPVAEVKDLSEE